MFTMEHIVRTAYPGDSQLDAFYEKWMEIVTNMRPGDMPPDDWLRNSLYKKIRSSTLLLYDIKQYESWLEGDPRKTYQYLIDSIERTIARIRDDKNMAARDKHARDFTASGRPSAPAPDVGILIPKQLHKLLRAIPKQKLAQSQRQHQNQRLHPFFLHHSRNNMRKGKGRKVSLSPGQQVPKTSPKSPANSTL